MPDAVVNVGAGAAVKLAAGFGAAKLGAGAAGAAKLGAGAALNVVGAAARGAPPKLLPPKLLGVLGAEKLVAAGAPNPPAGAEPNVVGLLDGKLIPPLFAPFNFSCVLPHAARPRTAPIAK